MITLAIDGAVTMMPAGWLCAIGASLALAVGLVVLVTGRAAVRQTTLLAPWWWAVVALLAWSGVELLAALATRRFGNGVVGSLRLAAITLSFCPVIALVGAKRPQDKAWQFVVLSLWAIATLPAAETYFLRPGQTIHIVGARAWFLWIPILLGPINYVPTRYWLAALLFAAAQIVALSPQLALIHRPLVPHAELIGLLLAAGALAVAWLASRRRWAAANAYDQLWHDFRNRFGLLWALRVQERVNAVAVQRQGNSELTWNGFRHTQEMSSASVLNEASLSSHRSTFFGLLRRFVSRAWINERMNEACREDEVAG